MGEVWRAVDTSQGDREVAVTVLGAWLGGDEDFARRFRRESALAAKLSLTIHTRHDREPTSETMGRSQPDREPQPP